MVKKLWSIFTDDMEHCIFTGSHIVERHHCFGAFNRERSEKYGFVVPLHPTFHPNGAYAPDDWKKIDNYLKSECQKYFIEHYGTKEDFLKEFGRLYETDTEDKTYADCDDGTEWVQGSPF